MSFIRSLVKKHLMVISIRYGSFVCFFTFIAVQTFAAAVQIFSSNQSVKRGKDTELHHLLSPQLSILVIFPYFKFAAIPISKLPIHRWLPRPLGMMKRDPTDDSGQQDVLGLVCDCCVHTCDLYTLTSYCPILRQTPETMVAESGRQVSPQQPSTSSGNDEVVAAGDSTSEI